MAKDCMDELGQCNNNSLLLQLIKDVSALSAKFDSFEKSRCEDNVELKESIKKVDDKVDKLDAKFEDMRVAHGQEIADVRDEISELKRAPLQDKAAKWESITKLVLEIIITACLGVILIKIGLK
jgi:chromosome segregation ATPase